MTKKILSLLGWAVASSFILLQYMQENLSPSIILVLAGIILFAGLACVAAKRLDSSVCFLVVALYTGIYNVTGPYAPLSVNIAASLITASFATVFPLLLSSFADAPRKTKIR